MSALSDLVTVAQIPAAAFNAAAKLSDTSAKLDLMAEYDAGFIDYLKAGMGAIRNIDTLMKSPAAIKALYNTFTAGSQAAGFAADQTTLISSMVQNATQAAAQSGVSALGPVGAGVMQALPWVGVGLGLYSGIANKDPMELIPSLAAAAVGGATAAAGGAASAGGMGASTAMGYAAIPYALVGLAQMVGANNKKPSRDYWQTTYSQDLGNGQIFLSGYSASDYTPQQQTYNDNTARMGSVLPNPKAPLQAFVYDSATNQFYHANVNDYIPAGNKVYLTWKDKDPYTGDYNVDTRTYNDGQGDYYITRPQVAGDISTLSEEENTALTQYMWEHFQPRVGAETVIESGFNYDAMSNSWLYPQGAIEGRGRVGEWAYEDFQRMAQDPLARADALNAKLSQEEMARQWQENIANIDVATLDPIQVGKFKDTLVVGGRKDPITLWSLQKSLEHQVGAYGWEGSWSEPPATGTQPPTGDPMATLYRDDLIGAGYTADQITGLGANPNITIANGTAPVEPPVEPLADPVDPVEPPPVAPAPVDPSNYYAAQSGIEQLFGMEPGALNVLSEQINNAKQKVVDAGNSSIAYRDRDVIPIGQQAAAQSTLSSLLGTYNPYESAGGLLLSNAQADKDFALRTLLNDQTFQQQSDFLQLQSDLRLDNDELNGWEQLAAIMQAAGGVSGSQTTGIINGLIKAGKTVAQGWDWAKNQFNLSGDDPYTSLGNDYVYDPYDEPYFSLGGGGYDPVTADPWLSTGAFTLDDFDPDLWMNL